MVFLTYSIVLPRRDGDDRNTRKILMAAVAVFVAGNRLISRGNNYFGFFTPIFFFFFFPFISPVFFFRFLSALRLVFGPINRRPS